MTAMRPTLTRAAAERYVRDACAGGVSSGRVGAEVEWLLQRRDDPLGMIDIEPVIDHATSLILPSGSTRVTFEPGGQLELSSDPLSSAEDACDAIAADVAFLRRNLPDLELVGRGAAPVSPHRRLRSTPRYDAMEAFFDAQGPHGRTMMNRTASIQVNLDGGADLAQRWQRAHSYGPLLVAMFANSPMLDGVATGWRSTRIANWWAMDATRTHSAYRNDPVQDWVNYALNANVMLFREGEHWKSVAPGTSFDAWIRNGIDGRFPDADDLAYHLTTLFPPVRLRGWIELRMIDALQDPWWGAAVLVSTAMLNNPAVSAIADVVVGPIAHSWLDAARLGLSAQVFAGAARAVFDAVIAHSQPSMWRDAVAAYNEQYVMRARTPADDLLDEQNVALPKEAAWS